MKKILSGLFLVAGILLASSKAYALPTIDGSLGAGEWDNVGYPYYLEVFDVNEAAIPDAYDIKHAILFQELTSFSGDADFTNDGVYLLIETYANAALADLDGAAPLGAGIALSGDFNADGSFDFFATLSAPADPFGGSPAAQKVSVTNLAVLLFNADLESNGGSFSRVDGTTSVIEFYFPAGKFGTPPSPPGTPFPHEFIGAITYDNSGAPPDDIVVGQLAPNVPEPNSMILLGTGFLSLLGLGISGKKFWL